MGAKAMRVRAFGVFLLMFCAAALPASARQNQSAPPDEPAASDQPAPARQQDQAQNGDATTGGPAEQQPQNAPAPPAWPLPATLTLPTGTLIPVRVSQWLSSDRNHTGDTFSAVLDQPLVVHGWVVARRGQTVIGRVDVAQKASDGNGVSKLGVEITELSLVDGEQLPVSTQMQQVAPSRAYPGSAERNVATVGTTTVLGTIVGAAVGGGTGAAIGAGLGATAGVAAILYTRGRPTSVAPETLLSFRLAAPVEISTKPGQVAFQPVTQGDYKDQDAYANGPRRRGPGPGYPPPDYYYGYCGPWGWSCYPGPYFGPYVGWGVGAWGPRFGGFGRFRR
ncbi:MAG TPA: hypothetical protein VGR64_06905 [Terracidiphilus sp.]|nr:hypothetical protein [Terracidiphilus sp.]